MCDGSRAQRSSAPVREGWLEREHGDSRRFRSRRPWQVGIGRATRPLRSDVVSKLAAGEVTGVALRDLWQHGGAPFVPFTDQAVIDVLVSVFQISALHRIG